MKNIVVSFFMVIMSVFGFGQTIVAEITKWSFFEVDITSDYEKIISDTSKVFTQEGFGNNKFTFNLSDNTYKFYLLDNEFAKGQMTYTHKSGVYVFICKTYDRKTGNNMDLYVTVNTNVLNLNDPYVSQYYLYEKTNKTYGMISFK